MIKFKPVFLLGGLALLAGVVYASGKKEPTPTQIVTQPAAAIPTAETGSGVQIFGGGPSQYTTPVSAQVVTVPTVVTPAPSVQIFGPVSPQSAPAAQAAVQPASSQTSVTSPPAPPIPVATPILTSPIPPTQATTVILTPTPAPVVVITPKPLLPPPLPSEITSRTYEGLIAQLLDAEARFKANPIRTVTDILKYFPHLASRGTTGLSNYTQSFLLEKYYTVYDMILALQRQRDAAARPYDDLYATLTRQLQTYRAGTAGALTVEAQIKDIQNRSVAATAPFQAQIDALIPVRSALDRLKQTLTPQSLSPSDLRAAKLID